jgi:hypothetical protein
MSRNRLRSAELCLSLMQKSNTGENDRSLGGRRSERQQGWRVAKVEGRDGLRDEMSACRAIRR